MIAIFPNPYRDTDYTVTKKVYSLLSVAGFDVAVCPAFKEEGVLSELPFEMINLDEPLENCSLAVVIGGDGTILSAFHQLNDPSIPIIGINMGTKGFLAALELENLEMVLQAARGELPLSERMLLSVELHRDGTPVFSGIALNDAVIHGYGECINLSVNCDGIQMIRFGGDGIVVATPTGSTGYSLSAGGPIVEPEAENIVLSPICAHSIGSKAYVVSPSRIISIETEKLYTRRAYLSVDGIKEIDILNKDLLIVQKSQQKLLMPRSGINTFYETISNKLM